jgi:hypothetical protein
VAAQHVGDGVVATERVDDLFGGGKQAFGHGSGKLGKKSFFAKPNNFATLAAQQKGSPMLRPLALDFAEAILICLGFAAIGFMIGFAL